MNEKNRGIDACARLLCEGKGTLEVTKKLGLSFYDVIDAKRMLNIPYPEELCESKKHIKITNLFRRGWTIREISHYFKTDRASVIQALEKEYANMDFKVSFRSNLTRKYWLYKRRLTSVEEIMDVIAGIRRKKGKEIRIKVEALSKRYNVIYSLGQQEMAAAEA